MAMPPARVRRRLASTVTVGNGMVSRGSELQFSEAGEVVLKGATSQQIVDPFQDQYITEQGELSIIQPPFSFMGLQRLPHENSMLRQCIEAMVVNIEGHGWRWEYVGPEDQEESPEAVSERQALEYLASCPNPDMSIDEMRSRWRRDLETLGNAFLEVMRDDQGEIIQVNHIPAFSLRLTYKDPVSVPLNMEVQIKDGPPKTVQMQKKFRRFVQRVGTRTVWFKEFGDPRVIDPTSGRVNEELKGNDTATEIIHTVIYAPGAPYGVPRWINQLPAILGSRQAELTNLDFFRENAIPALAVLVSGGKLTQTSLDQIEQHLNAARGRKSMNRVMVLEAKGDAKAAAEDGAVKPPMITLQPLSDARQKEGNFLTYTADAELKIRSAFRMPPLFVGQSQEYSHATAMASYEVAESQVFGPERRVTDDVVNKKMFSSVQPKFWALRSNPPRITDPDAVVAALTAFGVMGALTPNTAILMANEYFDLELPKITEAWGDLPFDLTKVIVQGAQVPLELKGLEKYVTVVEPTPPADTGDQNVDQNVDQNGAPGQGSQTAASTGNGGKGGGKANAGSAKQTAEDPLVEFARSVQKLRMALSDAVDAKRVAMVEEIEETTRLLQHVHVEV